MHISSYRQPLLDGASLGLAIVVLSALVTVKSLVAIHNIAPGAAVHPAPAAHHVAIR